MKNGVDLSTENCERIVEAMGHFVCQTSENDLEVDFGVWLIELWEEGTVGIRFHVNTSPSVAAEITKKFSLLATAMGFRIEIYDVYAPILDDDGDEVDIVFGEDAYELVGRERYPHDVR